VDESEDTLYLNLLLKGYYYSLAIEVTFQGAGVASKTPEVCSNRQDDDGDAQIDCEY